MDINLISPVDGRYSKYSEALTQFFSEKALMKYRVKVEVEWLITMGESNWLKEVRNLSQDEVKLLRGIVEGFSNDSALRIKEIEKTTNHDVKAVEYFIKEVLKDSSLVDVLEFIHFGCTSEDINNLSYAMMIKEGVNNVWLTKANELVQLVANAANDYKDIAIMAHTHGQPASPTTVGKELAIFVYRWKRQIKQLLAVEYLGKFSGAVGNFNAHYIAYPEVPWSEVSKNFIESLGITYNPLTTQIESHDYMSECFHIIERFNNITLDFNRDMWMYISFGYFKQRVVEGEVGSSTMPHKVNPISFETSEANLGLSNSVLGHLADKLQVSRMQRDLSDSSALRNVGLGIAYSYISLQYAITGFLKLSVNEEIINRDLNNSWEVLGEAIQTVMRKCGHEKPYEKLKELTRGKKINHDDIRVFVEGLKIPDEEKKRLISLTPATYIGIAPKLVDFIK